jgi:hypothetical protein
MDADLTTRKHKWLLNTSIGKRKKKIPLCKYRLGQSLVVLLNLKRL